MYEAATAAVELKADIAATIVAARITEYTESLIFMTYSPTEDVQMLIEGVKLGNSTNVLSASVCVSAIALLERRYAAELFSVKCAYRDAAFLPQVSNRATERSRNLPMQENRDHSIRNHRRGPYGRVAIRLNATDWVRALSLMLALLGCTSTSSAAYDIVDIFNALNNRTCRQSACDDVYFVARKGKDHGVQKRPHQNVYEIVVDAKRGYLRLSDEGTGGGNSVVTVALFRRQSGPPLLLETVNTYSGEDLRSSSLGIYVFDKGRFEAAPHLFPELRPIHFFRPGSVANFKRSSDQSEFVTQQNEDFIAFILPRYGTTIHSYLINFDSTACVKANWPEVPRAERERMCEAFSTKALGARTITYDRAAGQFRAESLKSARPPRLGERPE